MSLWRKFNERPAWRWVTWAVFVGLWTTALVLPLPEDRNWPVALSPGGKFTLAKIGHVGAYALMTILTGWLRVPVRFRLPLLFFLMAHAAATEWIQLRVPSRYGSVEDVVLDHLGIAAGLVLSWKWWSRDEGNQDRGA
ncbi:MAG TPA: VanZ family protein [Gemmataceae bacterium]|nr:VanZ family protein [Gemmataceae bacterium]